MTRIDHSFPGPAILKLQLWDYDPIVGDDFIGETEIDVESRYFDEKWMCTEYYPIETRELFKPETSVAVGSVRLWVEVLVPEAAKSNRLMDTSKHDNSLLSSHSGSRAEYEKVVANRKKWDISMMPPGGFELRVIVWDIQNCPIDDPEGLTDIYISCKMPSYDPNLEMTTDTHIRSEGFVLFCHKGVLQLENEVSHQIRRLRRQEQVRPSLPGMG